MKRYGYATIFLVLAVLSGCASHQTLDAPCPNYGRSCQKIPVNSWDYQNN